MFYYRHLLCILFLHLVEHTILTRKVWNHMDFWSTLGTILRLGPSRPDATGSDTSRLVEDHYDRTDRHQERGVKVIVFEPSTDIIHSL